MLLKRHDKKLKELSEKAKQRTEKIATKPRAVRGVFVPDLKKPTFEVPGYINDMNPSICSSRSFPVDGKKLLVGTSISMSGEVKDCDAVIVEGTIDATAVESRYIEVAESGVLKGNVMADEVVIAGKFNGKLHVNGKLTLASSAQVRGEITYVSLEVLSGAVINGTLKKTKQVDRAALDIATTPGAATAQKSA